MSLCYKKNIIFLSLLIISSCSTNDFYGETKSFTYNGEYNTFNKTVNKKNLVIKNGIFKLDDGTCLLQTEDFLGFNKIPIEDTYIETFTVKKHTKTISCPD